ncbi:phospholipase A2 inhibitor 31 kDa subunit-like [Leptodactylus fuscus]|uniref:phospholipase A2 inhibitor 31 kDa subunit-like n=1 Tax=Leptodactylus fuscus TaxID=238119 RepID=UPI003F4E811F
MDSRKRFVLYHFHFRLSLIPDRYEYYYFSTFFSSSPLRCYKCHARNSETCEHEIVECPKGERCMTISEDYKRNGTYHSIWKGCSRNVPCNVKPYGKANDEVYVMYNIKCCDEDCCNKEFYEMPPEEPPNGFVCPSCFVLGTTEECKPDNVTVCRGDQDKCLNFVGTVRKPDGVIISYAGKGCASPIGCRFAINQTVGVKALNTTVFECTSVSPRPSTDEEMEKIVLVP